MGEGEGWFGECHYKGGADSSFCPTCATLTNSIVVYNWWIARFIYRRIGELSKQLGSDTRA